MTHVLWHSFWHIQKLLWIVCRFLVTKILFVIILLFKRCVSETKTAVSHIACKTSCAFEGSFVYSRREWEWKKSVSSFYCFSLGSRGSSFYAICSTTDKLKLIQDFVLKNVCAGNTLVQWYIPSRGSRIFSALRRQFERSRQVQILKPFCLRNRLQIRDLPGFQVKAIMWGHSHTQFCHFNSIETLSSRIDSFSFGWILSIENIVRSSFAVKSSNEVND